MINGRILAITAWASVFVSTWGMILGRIQASLGSILALLFFVAVALIVSSVLYYENHPGGKPRH